MFYFDVSLVQFFKDFPLFSQIRSDFLFPPWSLDLNLYPGENRLSADFDEFVCQTVQSIIFSVFPVSCNLLPEI